MMEGLGLSFYVYASLDYECPECHSISVVTFATHPRGVVVHGARGPKEKMRTWFNTGNHSKRMGLHKIPKRFEGNLAYIAGPRLEKRDFEDWYHSEEGQICRMRTKLTD